MTTALANPPHPTPLTPAKSLDYIFRQSGLQKETMVDLLMADRRKSNEEYNRENAETDVSSFLDANEQKILATLTHARGSPVVSRETQVAILKGMILDYESNRSRKGLSALTVLKAVELLNKMTGYEAPVVTKHEHEMKINVFPVSAAPYVGSLPPLKVVDLDGGGTITMQDAPRHHASPIIDAVSTPAPAQPTPAELFP